MTLHVKWTSPDFYKKCFGLDMTSMMTFLTRQDE
jgi:hypothetical protein